MNFRNRLAEVAALIILLAMSGDARATVAGWVEARQVVIGVGPMELPLSKPQGEPQADPRAETAELLSKTIVDLFPTYLQRSFEQALGRRVLVRPMTSSDSSAQQQLWVEYHKDLRAIILPKIVNSGANGVHISAMYLLSPGDDTPPSGWASGEEHLLLAPNTDYGLLDRDLLSFGQRIVEKFRFAEPTPAANAPSGIAQFWCITPLDRTDSKAGQIATILTLELPYYLTEEARKRNLDLVVRGPGVWATKACQSPETAAQLSEPSIVEQKGIQSFAFDGNLISKPPRYQLLMRFNDGRIGYRPLPMLSLTEPTADSLRDLASQLMAAFVDAYKVVPHSATSREKFLNEYRSQFGALKPEGEAALHRIFDFIEHDKQMKDIRQVAYILATIKFETANTFESLLESGPDSVLEKRYAGKLGNDKAGDGARYKGRGYLQLTGKGNYRRLSEVLGVDLVENPDKALDPETAYRVTSYFMLSGTRGRKLDEFVRGNQADYVNARKVIEGGLAHASEIAKSAEIFENLLRESLQSG